MALTTYDQIIANQQYPITFTKLFSGTLTASRFYSSWGLAGTGGTGTFDTTLNGVVVSSASTGRLPFPDPPAGNTCYLSSIEVNAPASGILTLCDRLWHNGGITATITTAQSITSPTWPTRDNNASSNGDGVYIGLEVSAATGAGTPVISVGYTNSDGTSGKSGNNIFATSASPAAASFFPIELVSGDKGVRSVQSITLSATWTSGTINLVAYRPIFSMSIEQGWTQITTDPISGGVPQLQSNSAPFFLFLPGSAGTISGGALTGRMIWSVG